MKKLCLLLVFVIAFGLMGCAKDETQVLRFATWDSEDTLEVQKQIAKRFEELNPGVKVQVEEIGRAHV